jgi:hypothetical protein
MKLRRFALLAAAGLAVCAGAITSTNAATTSGLPIQRAGVRPAGNPFRITITGITPGVITPGANMTVNYKVELLSGIPCDSHTNGIMFGIFPVSSQSQPAGRPETGAPVNGTFSLIAPKAGSFQLLIGFTGDYWSVNPKASPNPWYPDNPYNGWQPCVPVSVPFAFGPALALPPAPFPVAYTVRQMSISAATPTPVPSPSPAHTVPPTPKL